VAAGSLVDDDPVQALEHARYARHRASRIAAVREAAGIAAYHAGEWSEALGELRAARRMGGGPGHLAVMADIERALGRPERAIELLRGPEVGELGRSEMIELAIVGAGARRDLGELDAAVVGLQLPELDPARRDPWSARLFYAYADNLLAAGREAEAVQWFVHATDADDEGVTDAATRLAELTGEPLPDDGDDVAFGEEDVPVEARDAELDDADADDIAVDTEDVVDAEEFDIAAEDIAAEDIAAEDIAAEDADADTPDDEGADALVTDEAAGRHDAADEVPATDPIPAPTDISSSDISAGDVPAGGVDGSDVPSSAADPVSAATAGPDHRSDASASDPGPADGSGAAQ
jgi:hypothetical protein